MMLDVMFSSESTEWYTPPDVVERVMAVLGEIDLDPCSNSHEHPNIPAREHYTKEDDGLAQWWHGRVYMNPPYGRGVDGIAEWTFKLACDYRMNYVTEAIALLPARTDTRWFRNLKAPIICTVAGRLKFSGHENGAPFPSVLTYHGPASKYDVFADAFAPIGDIWTPYRRGA